MLLWLLSCAAPVPDRILAYAWQGDGTHDIEPVPLGVIDDPVRMVTELGTGYRGGYLGFDDLFGDLNVEVRGGAPVHVQHVVLDGVFVPQDEQGLIFASFFHHLSGVRDEFVELGFGDVLDELFPVDGIYFGFTMLTELASFENAAFLSAGGVDGFVLFPDGNRDVPLGAHNAVVRHEFSHGLVNTSIELFDNDRIDEAEAIISSFELTGVDEGFADLVAALTLDDPSALPIAERDLSVRRTIDDIDRDDPYSLGTVLASFVWRVRERIGDPEATLLLAYEALEAWDREAWERGETFALRFADLFVTRVLERYPTERSFLCEQFEGRFQAQASSCSL